MSLDFSLHAVRSTEVYSGNITHNLGAMANKAGIYKCLWRPEENGFKKAEQIIPILKTGIEKLKKSPAKYKKYDSPNGWGLYEHFVPFVEEILKACEENPDAEIRSSV